MGPLFLGMGPLKGRWEGQAGAVAQGSQHLPAHGSGACPEASGGSQR